jgi:hypothetical protein
LAPAALAISSPSAKFAFPHRLRILIIGVDDPGERHAKLVFVADEFDTVLDIRQLFAERPDAAEPGLGPFHGVIGVEYYDQKKERQVQEAIVVVLAAWAAQNPRILLNSATDKHTKGLANQTVWWAST